MTSVANNLPVVSVVITAFNAADTISETLESVLGQSYQALEVIVVDDGSTDATAAIVQTQFPSVRLVRQSNSGQPAARNAGVLASRGEIIAFVDSDDLWHVDKLRHQTELLLQHPEAYWCYCDCVHFEETPDRPLYRTSQL